ncbi:CHY zinc finger protein [Microbacterium betulae]|uniref:CHY zinc finger protein n=1 Tax=Microbacterium betulae TaxID=2981139 RepID=A0AA97FG98_9MICO|nr:CHY zinc finger protein [Microbacterium sp. AB]WOF21725.1 CHY zinc finger protein [Microbacterium sp. AB]
MTARPIRVGGVLVHGAVVDGQTRCAHWHGADDVLAILFPCCRRWYPCHTCHEEDADHPAARWGRDEHEAQALLCGVCGATSSIDAYLATSACAKCGGAFNENCRLHHPLYFA